MMIDITSMTTTQVSQGALKRLRKIKTEAEYDSMETFLDDVISFLEENLDVFMENYGEVEEDEDEEETED